MSFATAKQKQPFGLPILNDGRSPPGSLLEIAQVSLFTISNAANQNAEINTEIKNTGKGQKRISAHMSEVGALYVANG